MRIFGALLICMLVTGKMNAQKKLKFDVDKTTGDTTWRTSEERLYVKAGAKGSIAEYIKSTVYKKDNFFMLGFEIQTGRTSVFSIERDQSATITLQNGEEIVVNSLQNQSSKASHMGYGSFIFAFYELTSNDIKLLKSSPVSSIRVHSSTGNMDYEIKEKFSEIIKDQVLKF